MLSAKPGRCRGRIVGVGVRCQPVDRGVPDVTRGDEQLEEVIHELREVVLLDGGDRDDHGVEKVMTSPS